MGPIKLKWTAEEEAAIRDGINKHGVGKWRLILDDPELGTVLLLRSNVDLKDKWRNMNLAKSGESRSRNGYKPVEKNIKKTTKRCNKSVALTSEGCDEGAIAQPEQPAIINESSEEGGSDKLTSRFDDGKLEGVTNVKEPSSSTQKQEQLPPPNLERFSWENIKTFTADGKFKTVQQDMKYDSVDRDSIQAEVDAELMRMRQMNPEDAFAAAAAAVKKAEDAIAEAEEAEREAVEAERAAEEAKAVAEELERQLREKKAKPDAAAAPKRGKRGRRKC